MNWPVVNLSQIADIVGGSTPRRNQPQFWGGEIPWITPTDLPMPGHDIAEVDTTAEAITELGLSSCSAQLLPVGSVLLSSRATIGKIGIARVPLATNQGFANFLPKPLVDSRFLAYALLRYTEPIAALAGKTTFREVSKGTLKRYRMALPPLSEQRLIARILDQANTLRRKRREADAKAERILPALFYKTFGDPLALVISGEGIALADLAVDLQNGFACGEKDVEGGVPHLRMNNIDDAGVLNMQLVRTVPLDRDAERYRLAERDVLFMGTNSEDKIGKACLFLPPDDRTYLFSNHLIRLRVSDSRVTPEYFAAFLHLLWCKRFFPSIAKRWVNQSSVAMSSLAALRVPLPEARPLARFTNMYRDLFSLRSRRVQSRRRIDRIFSVLLHRAFAGDLTAKWREARKEQLEAEMEEQVRMLQRRPSLGETVAADKEEPDDSGAAEGSVGRSRRRGAKNRR